MTSFEGFQMKDAIFRYTCHLVADIRNVKKREAVREEYAAHIEDAMYDYMLEGENEQDAFKRVRDDLGDATMIQELLAATHNKDPLPSFVKWMIFGALLGGIMLSYVLIKNRVYRSWVMLFTQLFLLGMGVFVVYLAYRVFYCLRARLQTLKKIRTFAKENGLTVTVKYRGLRGAFRPTEHADLVIDTPTHRYILALWGTFSESDICI